MLHGFSLGNYTLFVDYTGRFFCDGKAAISADLSQNLTPPHHAESWHARLDKLKAGSSVNPRPWCLSRPFVLDGQARIRGNMVRATALGEPAWNSSERPRFKSLLKHFPFVDTVASACSWHPFLD